MDEQDAIDEMFEDLVEGLREMLPDFGERLASDSKAISSVANRPPEETAPDGRRDRDADFGRKEYRSTREDGSGWTKVIQWFGYKLHLLADATYELPVAWEVTKASADITRALPSLDHVQTSHPELMAAAMVLTADRGYDATGLLRETWDTHGIKPVIDIRNMWKEALSCVGSR